MENNNPFFELGKLMGERNSQNIKLFEENAELKEKNKQLVDAIKYIRHRDARWLDDEIINQALQNN